MLFLFSVGCECFRVISWVYSLMVLVVLLMWFYGIGVCDFLLLDVVSLNLLLV